jgi:hypothetical protein
MAEKTNSRNWHIFVKYGSSMIDEKIGKIVKNFDLKYVHRHEGRTPKVENRFESYNRNMKVKPCTIYKFTGEEKKFNALLDKYSNLEIISDTN